MHHFIDRAALKNYNDGESQNPHRQMGHSGVGAGLPNCLAPQLTTPLPRATAMQRAIVGHDEFQITRFQAEMSHQWAGIGYKAHFWHACFVAVFFLGGRTDPGSHNWQSSHMSKPTARASSLCPPLWHMGRPVTFVSHGLAVFGLPGPFWTRTGQAGPFLHATLLLGPGGCHKG